MISTNKCLRFFANLSSFEEVYDVALGNLKVKFDFLRPRYVCIDQNLLIVKIPTIHAVEEEMN